MKSYTSTSGVSLAGRFSEMWNLYKRHSHGVSDRISVSIERLRNAQQVIEQHWGEPLKGKELLEIGPGQLFQQMLFFGRDNDVVGIDLDVIVQGFDPAGYWQLLRQNGLVRTVKTLGRKVSGADASFRREFARQFGLRRIPNHRVLRMDAEKLDFSDSSFDCVYSFSVFQHLPEPSRAMREVKRVLRPGGVSYVSLHLYTSDSGCHDPRIFASYRKDIPYWSHLRPAHQHRVQCNAFLNRLGLADWQQQFEKEWPGVRFICLQHDNAELVPELERLRKAGELSNYSDDELLTVDLVAVWRNPLAPT